MNVKAKQPIDVLVRSLRGGWHPVQMKALTILSERVASPKQIAIELGMTKAKAGYISRHVKQLCDRGLVELDHVTPVRGVKEHFYRASVPFVVMGEEAEQMTLEDRLVLSCWIISCINRDFLRAVETKTIDERTDRHLTRIPLCLDEQGISDLFTEHNRAFHRTNQIQSESMKRREVSNEPGRPVSAILASFPMPLDKMHYAWTDASSHQSNDQALGAEEAVKATARILRDGWHPVQMKALTILSERVASPKQIAIELGMTKAKAGLVSYHVKELRKRGQVDLMHTVSRRGANEHFYRASVPFVVMGEEAEQMTLEDRLVLSCWIISCINRDFLRAVETKTIDERTDRHLTRIPLCLDEQGISDLFTEHNRAFHRTNQIQSESMKRREVSNEPGRPVTAIAASFLMPI